MIVFIRRMSRKRGQATVEFALCSIMLFALILGILETGRLVYTIAALSHAVNTGARVAALPGTPDMPTIQTAVVDSAYSLAVNPADVTVTVTGTTTTYSLRDTGDDIQVGVTYVFRPVIESLFPWATFTLSRSTSIFAEGQP